MATYRVIARTSTRASIDPKAPEFEAWVDYEPGQLVESWPAHAPVDEWVASGHWIVPLDEADIVPDLEEAETP